MSEITFIVAQAILIAAIGFISTVWQLINKKKKGFIRRIRFAGWLVIIINLVLIGLIIFQYKINQTNQENRDNKLKISYDLSLKKNKENFDKSYEKIIKIIASTLGKYGYKYDSSQKVLKKIIIDSAKTKIIMPESPVLSLDDIEPYKNAEGKSFLKIGFYARGANCKYIKLTSTLLQKNKDTLEFLNTKEIPEIEYMIKDCPYGFYLDCNNSLPDFYYIYINGTYENVEGQKKSINTLYMYITKSKRFLFSKADISRNKNIMDFINSNFKK